MTNLILLCIIINMDNISFQSRIKLTSRAEFSKFVNREFAQVNYPWTIKQTALSNKARTDGVYDCTAMGITDGDKVLLLHICPTDSRNQNFKKLENKISESILSKLNPDYLQGFILGSKKDNINSPFSSKLFEIMEGILKKLNIPYSKFKGGNYTNDIAYNSTKDEWIIGNELLDVITTKEAKFKTPQKAAEKIFDQIKIADCDELSW